LIAETNSILAALGSAKIHDAVNWCDLKAIWLGTVEAPDKQAGVEKAAQEFKTEVWRLYAVARRWRAAK
jgi:hypothetical protein